jgi:hypothetical protein
MPQHSGQGAARPVRAGPVRAGQVQARVAPQHSRRGGTWRGWTGSGAARLCVARQGFHVSPGEASRGGAGRCMARPDKACLGSERRGKGFMYHRARQVEAGPVEAGHGAAGLVIAGHCRAGQVVARPGIYLRSNHGAAGRGLSGRVMAGPVRARLGFARQGFHLRTIRGGAGAGMERRGWSGRGSASHGPAGQGQASHGKGFSGSALVARLGLAWLCWPRQVGARRV